MGFPGALVPERSRKLSLGRNQGLSEGGCLRGFPLGWSHCWSSTELWSKGNTGTVGVTHDAVSPVISSASLGDQQKTVAPEAIRL